MFFANQDLTKLSPLDATKAVYALVLSRPLDATGLAFWTRELEQSPFSCAKLLDNLLGSQEFRVVHDSIDRKERLRRGYQVLRWLEAEHAQPIAVASAIYRMVLNRAIDERAMAACQTSIKRGIFSRWLLIGRLINSKEFKKQYQRPMPSHKLHAARMAWVAQLPASKTILDIGGSSPNIPEGALIELGYKHRPEKLIIFDKPPAEQYWGTPNYSQANTRIFPWGQVQYVHGYAEDILQNPELSAQRFDMIFMGQVVEHIYEEKLSAVLKWIKDHLADHGIFYFDTPNRLITQYETGDGGYIDPDHKREYTPDALAQILAGTGFAITQQWGILEMPSVAQKAKVSVENFYEGALMSPTVENAYCFAMACANHMNLL